MQTKSSRRRAHHPDTLRHCGSDERRLFILPCFPDIRTVANVCPPFGELWFLSATLLAPQRTRQRPVAFNGEIKTNDTANRIRGNGTRRLVNAIPGALLPVVLFVFSLRR